MGRTWSHCSDLANAQSGLSWGLREYESLIAVEPQHAVSMYTTLFLHRHVLKDVEMQPNDQNDLFYTTKERKTTRDSCLQSMDTATDGPMIIGKRGITSVPKTSCKILK